MDDIEHLRYLVYELRNNKNIDPAILLLKAYWLGQGKDTNIIYEEEKPRIHLTLVKD